MGMDKPLRTQAADAINIKASQCHKITRFRLAQDVPMSEEKVPSSLPKAIDLSHHLSVIAKARHESPLKNLMKYMGKPGAVELAGGIPDPHMFPFENIHIDTLLPNTFAKKNSGNSSFFDWLWSVFRTSPKTETYSISKFASKPEDIDLAHALQYSMAKGTVQLQSFVQEFSKKVFAPPYADWTTLAHCGNTDAISRCFTTFCNAGDSILVEEWTYPSALATAQPIGAKVVPVKVDGQGMSADDLERILRNWDEETQGRMPHVMYTVPIGQNPTGATMGPERKRAIYDICVRYDIVIMEDDPYYFLQEGVYVPKSERAKLPSQNDDTNTFLRNLAPSFLKFDYQGRVVRFDSFSKIIAPGSRMGWITCSPLFAERLERHAETSTQSPSGFSQAIITQLVTKQWGSEKFFRWLQGLQGEYTLRRDFMVDCIYDLFDVLPATQVGLAAFGDTSGLPVVTAYLKESTAKTSSDSEKFKSDNPKTPLFSFIPPTSGMFIWIKFHVGDTIILKPGETVGIRLFIDLAEEGLLIAPGFIFAADEPSAVPQPEAQFRISFSNGTQEELLRGITILEKIMRRYSTL